MNKRTCLVVVDMQNGFINQHTEHLVDKISEFIKTASFDSIVGTMYVNHENTACYKFEGWKGCMIGTDEARIVDPIISSLDLIFEKDKYSCWNRQVRDYIEINEFDKVYLVGVNTGCCVLHSALDMYNDLQDCCIIEDLCGSTSGDESHKAALKILRETITKQRVITSEQALKEIGADNEN